MPLHLGHEFLINEGLRSSDTLTVLVCSIPNEPIDGNLRYAWVKQRFPSANVIHVTDIVPQTPRAHPDFWGIWRRLIFHYHPEKVDAVFTSERYGEKLSRVLDCKHVCIDRKRTSFPVSGAKIRRDPVRYWRFISKPARPAFVKKVLIYGAESTGKTTLAKRLARDYKTTWSPEYARTYIEEKLDDNLANLGVNDQVPIAFGHTALENEKLKDARTVLFTDTDAITTCIYFDHYFGYVDPRVLELSNHEKYDLILLNHPDVPWAVNRQRDLGHQREQMHSKFVDGLASRGLKWVDIRGNWENRWRLAKNATDSVLSKGITDSPLVSANRSRR